MKYTNEHLDYAVEKKVLSQEQKNDFITLIESDFSGVSPVQKFLYYGGSLLVISALTWLLGSSWSSFGPIGLAIISGVYFVGFLLIGCYLISAQKIILAGSLMFCIAIAVVPLLAYSILKIYDFWPSDYSYSDFYVWIKGKWIVLEIATIIVAVIILIRIKFHFIVFMISFCLWFLSMDIVPVIYRTNYITWTERAHISILFGIVMIVIGYVLHVRRFKDFSFWLYLFGLLTLTSGLSVFYNVDSSSLYILIFSHLLLLIVSLFLRQTVFMVFGVIGIGEFLSRISYIWFRDSPLFPFSLTIIGVALITTGIVYQKNRKAVDRLTAMIIPPFMGKLRPLE